MLLAIPPAWGGIKSRSNAGAMLCSSLLRGDGAQAAQRACGVSFSGELQTCTYKILYNVLWVTLRSRGVGLQDLQRSLPTLTFL